MNNSYTPKVLLTILFSLVFFASKAQFTISVDTLACGQDTATLRAAVLGEIPTGIDLSVDDGYSDTVNIGFPFKFFGTTHTQCVISSNGYICFDLSMASTPDVPSPSAWDIEDPIPTNPNIYNSFCGVYSDIYPLLGGTVSYATVGVAPHRKFVVTFCSNPMFECTDQLITFQMILCETSNFCEVHIAHKEICADWNGGNAIEGVEDATGTYGITVPGRNYPSEWTATHDGQRFTPTGPTSYSVAAIPYSPVPYATSTIYWFDSATHALVDSGTAIHIAPTTATTYIAMSVGCDDTLTATYRVASIDSLPTHSNPVHIDTVLGVNPTYCGACNGTIVLTGIRPHELDTVFYTYEGALQPLIVDSAGLDSTIVIHNLCAGTYDNFFAKHENCISNVVGPIILINPPLLPSFDTSLHYGCAGDTLFITNTSGPLTGAPLHYHWNFGDGTTDTVTTAPRHVYTAQGTFTVTLTVTNYACDSTITKTLTINHPLSASFRVDKDSICAGGTITFTNASVAIDPGYLWNFGDGSATDVSKNPSHTYTDAGIYTVRLRVSDFRPCFVDTTIGVYVQSINAKTDTHDTTVCLAIPMPLNTSVTTIPDGVSGINYSWTPVDGLDNIAIAQPNFFTIGDYNFVFTATTPLGCSSSDNETVHSLPPLVLTNVTPDQAVTYGSTVQLNADPGYYYYWTPDNGSLDNPNIHNPIATITDSVTYMVHVVSQYGCADSQAIHIAVIYEMHEIVPNAFTPNGDGLNDVFRVGNLGADKILDFRVFNRWGQLIYHSGDADAKWDGTFNGAQQEIGVYSYMIIVGRPDGTKKEFSGNVNLLR